LTSMGTDFKLPIKAMPVKKGKGKVVSYLLLSIGPGADPGLQTVSPQVTF